MVVNEEEVFVKIKKIYIWGGGSRVGGGGRVGGWSGWM